MKFRPCIDIHIGKVKQIVGGSLTDVQDQASENFVSEQDASFYAELYKKAGIKGGHVILLNGHDSPYYESTKEQAILAGLHRAVQPDYIVLESDLALIAVVVVV